MKQVEDAYDDVICRCTGTVYNIQIYDFKMIDWFIDYFLTSREQYFSFVQDENYNNKKTI